MSRGRSASETKNAEVKEEKITHGTIKRQILDKDFFAQLTPYTSGEPPLVPFNKDLILANTKNGLRVFNTKNNTITPIKNAALPIEEKKDAKSLPINNQKSVQVAPISNNQFARLCVTRVDEKSIYSLEIWKIENIENNEIKLEKNILLPPISDHDANPRFLSLDPIRISFEEPSQTEPNDLAGFLGQEGAEIISANLKQHAMLTIGNNDQEIGNENKKLVTHNIPKQILQNNRYVASPEISDNNPALHVFNKHEKSEKKLNASFKPKILKESPDKKHWAVVDAKNKLKIYRVTEKYDLKELKKINDLDEQNINNFQWLPDGNLVYLSKNGIELFKPETLNRVLLFSTTKPITNLMVTPNNNITFLQDKELVSLTISSQPLKQKLLESTPLPYVLTDIIADFVGSQGLYQQEAGSLTQLSPELQKKVKQLHDNLETKVTELTNQHEKNKNLKRSNYFKRKDAQLDALNDLIKDLDQLSNQEKISNKKIQEIVGEAKKKLPKSYFFHKNDTGKLFDEISKYNPAEQKHTTSTIPTKKR